MFICLVWTDCLRLFVGPCPACVNLWAHCCNPADWCLWWFCAPLVARVNTQMVLHLVHRWRAAGFWSRAAVTERAHKCWITRSQHRTSIHFTAGKKKKTWIKPLECPTIARGAHPSTLRWGRVLLILCKRNNQGCFWLCVSVWLQRSFFETFGNSLPAPYQ